MFNVSTQKLLSWKKKQLLIGGDVQSLNFLLDSVGGLSNKKLNLIKFKSEQNIKLKVNLEYLEILWDKHISSSIPIQHLCGLAFWRDLRLEVSNKVLIPRPETELIIDIALETFKDRYERITFVDLGTGSGAISIALALKNPQWFGIATDIDKNAIEIASRNYANCPNNSNLKFICGHWWEPLKNFEGEIDLAISNPPYIPRETYEKLPTEVKKYEPKTALLGGESGLDHIQEIVKKAPIFLREKGFLILENHFNQGDKVKNIFLENGFTLVKVLQDFSGIGRFTIGRYK